MNQQYSQEFKVNAVKKALNKSETSSMRSVADSLNIASSTLHTWVSRAKKNQLELGAGFALADFPQQEKSPHDWTLAERFEMIIKCEPLTDEEVSQVCREQGIHLHHLAQWKEVFLMKKSQSPSDDKMQLKALKEENKQLKKEVLRKDKALAETAALLVLQKKVQAIWGSNEGDS